MNEVWEEGVEWGQQKEARMDRETIRRAATCNEMTRVKLSQKNR